jgi:hypothetical protein
MVAGTVSVFAQKKRFQPNARILSRQKNDERVNTQQQQLLVSITADGATFTFDGGSDRIEIAEDQYGRWGFKYYNNGTLTASGVWVEEPVSVTEVSWGFNFTTIHNRSKTNFKSGDVWTWKVRL